MNKSSSNRDVLSRRDSQAQETRTRLMDAALRLFAAQGLEATTIKDIAQAAGVAQGLLYRYFENKEELFWAILDTHIFLPRLQQVLTDRAEQLVEAVLRALVGSFDEFMGQKQTLLRVIMQELQTNERIAAVWAQYLEREQAPLRAFLEARIRAGELRPHDPRVTMHLLMWTTVTLHMQGVDVTADRAAFLDDMVRTIVGGIRAGT